ncbi:hypothetical protein LXL04_020446 [Taraxacum kok-saghyz]
MWCTHHYNSRIIGGKQKRFQIRGDQQQSRRHPRSGGAAGAKWELVQLAVFSRLYRVCVCSVLDIRKVIEVSILWRLLASRIAFTILVPSTHTLDIELYVVIANQNTYRVYGSNMISERQDEKAFYLDPHGVQQVVNISKDNLEADTSSYHCNVVRQIPLEPIDPSLAIGFYCRDKDDFEDFCSRASELATESNGAPLFTVTQTRHLARPSGASRAGEEDGADSFDGVDDAEGSAQDDWQLL